MATIEDQNFFFAEQKAEVMETARPGPTQEDYDFFLKPANQAPEPTPAPQPQKRQITQEDYDFYLGPQQQAEAPEPITPRGKALLGGVLGDIPEFQQPAPPTPTAQVLQEERTDIGSQEAEVQRRRAEARRAFVEATPGSPEALEAQRRFQKLDEMLTTGSIAQAQQELGKAQEEFTGGEGVRKFGGAVARGGSFGLADLAFSPEVKADLAPSDEREAVLLGLTEFVSALNTGQAVAPVMKSLVAKAGLKGAVAGLAARMATGGVIGGIQNFTAVQNEQKSVAEALRDTGTSMLVSGAGLVPETMVKGGVGNLAAQVLFDFGVDTVVDKFITKRLRDDNFKEWFINEELPQLVASTAFAASDYADYKQNPARFEADRMKLKQEVLNKFKKDVDKKFGSDFAKEIKQAQVSAPVQDVRALVAQAKATGRPNPIDKLDRKNLEALAESYGMRKSGMALSLKKRLKTMVESEATLVDPNASGFEKLAAATKIQRDVIMPQVKQQRSEEITRRVAEIAELTKDVDDPLERQRIRKEVLSGDYDLQRFDRMDKFFTDAEKTEIRRAGEEVLRTLDATTYSDAVGRLMEGKHLREHELKLMGEVHGEGFTKAHNENRNDPKFLTSMIESANFMRQMKTMLDASMLLRQGALALPRYPKQYFDALKGMGKVAFNENNYRLLHDSFKADPMNAVREEAGLYVAPPNANGKAPDLSAREEAFASDWMDKIPVLRSLSRVSERVFNGFLNTLRVNIFDSFVKNHPDSSIEEYRQMADWVNKMTGRGGFDKRTPFGKKVEAAMPLAGTLLFSPRWALSRIQAPLAAITPIRDADGKVRFTDVNRDALLALGGYTAMVGVIMALLKLRGAKVETDSRSSDFGKVVNGNTRVDLTAGMGQYMRFLTQLARKESKSLATGKVREHTPRDTLNLIVRMLRSKLSPGAGVMLSAITGKQITGEEFVPIADPQTIKAITDELGFSKQAAEAAVAAGGITLRELVPLIIQQTYEGYKIDGLTGAVIGAGGEFLGLGTSTFEPRAKPTRSPRRRGRRGRPRRRRTR